MIIEATQILENLEHRVKRSIETAGYAVQHEGNGILSIYRRQGCLGALFGRLDAQSIGTFDVCRWQIDCEAQYRERLETVKRTLTQEYVRPVQLSPTLSGPVPRT